jgi:ADP-ribosylglycohydrolase
MIKAEKKLQALTNSALWAAYGDALGFITELSTQNSLKFRTNINVITTTIPWRRTIGGKFGAKVQLLAGTYSDDTQLRLATSRAIRDNGDFDVEAFAKVELPVWLSYALGAGRGSKEAASSLSRKTVNWFSNFYQSKDSNYIHGGGNGAAMRIQPHVWASKDVGKVKSYLPDVIKNSICTHGHARGILGAVFHAICLADTIKREDVLTPDDWIEIANFLPNIIEMIKNDINLSTLWLPTWEAKSQQKLYDAFLAVRDEIIEDIYIIKTKIHSNLPKEQNYTNIVEAIKASTPEQKGSATKTALLASVLCYLYKDSPPSEALITCVNYLNSDTDTIATMAGALLGVVTALPPEGELQDRAYIINEIERLFFISVGKKASNFSYPDLLHWQAPRVSLDSVGVDQLNNIVLSGIGRGKLKGPEYLSSLKSEDLWQLLELDFGQSLLCKRRKLLKQVGDINMPQLKNPTYSQNERDTMRTFDEKPEINDLFRPENEKSEDKPEEISQSLDRMTSEAIKSGFNPAVIGSHILNLSSKADGIEQSIAYVAIISKARIARMR